jgi:curli biogenesis system outer membrane secretion channel CsgG
MNVRRNGSVGGFKVKFYRGFCIALTLAVALPVSISSAYAQEATAAASQNKASKNLKRKIAVGRFTNETRYGQTLLRDANLDPLGKQAVDILAAHLVQTGKFLVFERTDTSQIDTEQRRIGAKNELVGVDTLIIGSIVEFGRSEDGKRGVFNRQRVQRAQAKVAIRLVDVRTGLAFFSATGAGEATTEAKTTFGIGSTAQFDGTLTDKALSAAIVDVLEEMSNTIQARQWRTDILAVEDGQVYVSGGPSQGLVPGDRLIVMKAGKTVTSSQTGIGIELPSTEVAELEVVSSFGSGDLGEGSISRVISGSVKELSSNIYVVSK